jgi:hypothetical protein
MRVAVDRREMTVGERAIADLCCLDLVSAERPAMKTIHTRLGVLRQPPREHNAGS